MTAALLIPIVFFLVFGLGVFFWFWWAAPRSQVPLHLNPDEIKQLELQDRLRQTNYQILTALGLVATFVTTIVQLSITSRQWTSDYDLRFRHEQAQQFTEAAKDLSQNSSSTFAEQAAYRIFSITVRNPEDFSREAHHFLTSVIREQTKDNKLKGSTECFADSAPPGQPRAEYPTIYTEREEPPPAAQAAISRLGSREFARLRRASADACIDSNENIRLHFDHFKLDNFDLSWGDLSCATLTQTTFRRAVLRGAKLLGADMRGARLADYDIPGSPAQTGWLNGHPYTMQQMGQIQEWQHYRCFRTDLGDADLRAVDFEGAALGGANLAGADLTGANLCNADISRANFTGAKGLTLAMLRDSCVGPSVEVPEGQDPGIDQGAQPLGLREIFPRGFEGIRRCPTTKRCAPMNHDAATAATLRPHW